MGGVGAEYGQPRTEAVATVSLLDLVYCSGDGNHDGGSPFHPFGIFFIFNSYDDKICFNDRQGLIPKHIVDQQLYYRFDQQLYYR